MTDTPKLITVTVSIPGIIEARDFCHVAEEHPGDVDLRQGRYVVDAKSMLGILSLNLKKAIQLDVYGDGADALIQKLEKYINPG